MSTALHLLLKGRILLKEITSKKDVDKGIVRWVEINIFKENTEDNYPFRLDNYAMLKKSPYFSEMNKDSSLFRMRVSAFKKYDLDNGCEPSYDEVGDFIKIIGLDNLNKMLEKNNLCIDDFIDASLVEEYPL